MAEGLCLWSEPVRPEWVDYNGHMSEAYYVLVFGHATDALYEHVGMGDAYRIRSACSLYTVESHIQYLREVGEGVMLDLETRVLGVDQKRLHFCHRMTSTDNLLATTELMVVHVDARAGGSVDMTKTDQACCRDLVTTTPPTWTGRSIRNLMQ